MQAEEKGTLQDALKELLSAAPETPKAPFPEGGDTVETATPPAATAAESTHAPEPTSEQPESRVSDPQTPAYEVEIVPPPAVEEDRATGRSRIRLERESKEAATKPDHAASAALEGTVEIQIRQATSLARISEFEQALRLHQGLHWLGTFGKAKQGTTITVELSSKVPAAELFEGPTGVEKLELVRSGKIWQARVLLPSEAPRGNATPPAPGSSEVNLQPTASTPASPPLTEPAAQPPQSYAPLPPKGAPSQVDLEASPVASLDALNRFEKILTSLGPRCRVVNVLSLDGVSTVLITVEGLDPDTLCRSLPDKISGVKIETNQDRVVAKLPENWGETAR